MKTSDNFKKMLSIEHSFVKGNAPALVASHRTSLREGPITEIDEANKKRKSLYLFLFNDLLVVGKPLLMSRFKFKLEAPILQTFIIDIPESPTSTFAFTIQAPRKTFTVQTQKLQEKIDWMKEINEARDKQMEIEGAKITFKLLKREEEKKNVGKAEVSGDHHTSTVAQHRQS